MPNWCANTFAVYGDRDQLNKLYDHLNTMMDPAAAEEAGVNYHRELAAMKKEPFNEQQTREDLLRCDPWIVYVFNKFYKADVLENLGMNVRGYLTGVDDQRNSAIPHIMINSDSAWGPWNEFFEKVLEDHFPDLKFEMLAEECGWGLYVNTDTTGRFFSVQFHSYNSDEGSGYFDSIDELKSYLTEQTGFNCNKFTDFKGLSNFMEKYNDFCNENGFEDSSYSIDEYSNE